MVNLALVLTVGSLIVLGLLAIIYRALSIYEIANRQNNIDGRDNDE